MEEEGGGGSEEDRKEEEAEKDELGLAKPRKSTNQTADNSHVLQCLKDVNDGVVSYERGSVSFAWGCWVHMFIRPSLEFIAETKILSEMKIKNSGKKISMEKNRQVYIFFYWTVSVDKWEVQN